jgi:hypothetical protein
MIALWLLNECYCISLLCLSAIENLYKSVGFLARFFRCQNHCYYLLIVAIVYSILSDCLVIYNSNSFFSVYDWLGLAVVYAILCNDCVAIYGVTDSR